MQRSIRYHCPIFASVRVLRLPWHHLRCTAISKLRHRQSPIAAIITERHDMCELAVEQGRHVKAPEVTHIRVHFSSQERSLKDLDSSTALESWHVPV